MFDYFNDLLSLFDTHPLMSTATLLAGLLAWLVKGTIFINWTEGYKERRLKKINTKRKSKLISNAQEVRKNQSGKLFSFGRAKASVYVFDHYFPGYPKGFLLTTMVESEIDVPVSLKCLYEEKVDYWNSQKELGRIFEGAPKLALKKISIDRAPVSEEKRFRVQISESSSYVHQRAATDVFVDIDEEARNEYISDPSHTMSPFFSNSFGIIIGIITGDEQIVFVERSRSTAVNENRIICGAVEGMTMGDVTLGGLDPIKAASRALAEEFGISLDHNELSAIRITACVFNVDFHEWNLVGHVDLRAFGDKYISAVIHDYNTTAKAHDSWEVSEIVFIDFDPISVAGYLASHDHEVVNYSVVTAIYALLSTHGEEEVRKAFSTDFK